MSAQRTTGWWLAVAGGIIATASVIMAIVMIGSPSAQRDARLDARRVDDLMRLERAIEDHARKFDVVPPDLATLAKTPGNADLPLADAETGAAYEYQRGDKMRYRLCATFSTDSATSPPVAWEPERWRHGAGHQCFPLRVRANVSPAEALRDIENARLESGGP